MNTNNIFTLLNHPLTMVILGSSMGWLFVTYIWTPYNNKKINENKTKHYKKEVFLRLAQLKISFEKQHNTKAIAYLLEGKTTLNPYYKFWKLNTLILSGWSEYVYQNTYKILQDLQALVAESQTIIDEEKTKKGLLLVNKLTIYLKNVKEN